MSVRGTGQAIRMGPEASLERGDRRTGYAGLRSFHQSRAQDADTGDMRPSGEVPTVQDMSTLRSTNSVPVVSEDSNALKRGHLRQVGHMVQSGVHTIYMCS